MAIHESTNASQSHSNSKVSKVIRILLLAWVAPDILMPSIASSLRILQTLPGKELVLQALCSHCNSERNMCPIGGAGREASTLKCATKESSNLKRMMKSFGFW